ncbi:hypothetical protein LOZ58_004283 [Ophidiomyces ophidiicola]|nr:hypothetical protein LOZ65_004654 [Ophidiomyces ophidiicola]KAI1935780.1 hypothetical protein LOZ66_005015 [Ophidiomyces ophidiicola]KAI1959918.1 hypothetical protein LOZ58_004283 [Ophidiomyces ophidiicola]
MESARSNVAEFIEHVAIPAKRHVMENIHAHCVSSRVKFTVHIPSVQKSAMSLVHHALKSVSGVVRTKESVNCHALFPVTFYLAPKGAQRG